MSIQPGELERVHSLSPTDHLWQALDPYTKFPRRDTLVDIDAKDMISEVRSHFATDTGKFGEDKSDRVHKKVVKVGIAMGGIFPRISVEEHVDEDNTQGPDIGRGRKI